MPRAIRSVVDSSLRRRAVSSSILAAVAIARRIVLATILSLSSIGIATPAGALVVQPYFLGHGTIDATTSTNGYTLRSNAFIPLLGSNRADIDVAHGMVSTGGILGGPIAPGDWGFDVDVWGPLINNIDIQRGGVVTYGFPVPDVFAVTWVDVANAEDPTVRNTFQVVFVGAAGFHTNAGFAIAPGSVVFAYGAPGDPHGTIHLSLTSPATIGSFVGGILSTLQPLGVGDALGIVHVEDVPALQSSGDPFLFNRGESGLEPPLAFDSLQETIPEPGFATGLFAGLAGLVVRARRR